MSKCPLINYLKQHLANKWLLVTLIVFMLPNWSYGQLTLTPRVNGPWSNYLTWTGACFGQIKILGGDPYVYSNIGPTLFQDQINVGDRIYTSGGALTEVFTPSPAFGSPSPDAQRRETGPGGEGGAARRSPTKVSHTPA